MAAILSVTYTPNYPGNHRICFRTTGSAYCCYNDDSASVVGVSKTTEIDLEDFKFCLVDLPEPVGCAASVVEGYIQPICIEQSSDVNRIEFTAEFPSTQCTPYKLICYYSSIISTEILDGGSGYQAGEIPAVTFSSIYGQSAAADAIMGCVAPSGPCFVSGLDLIDPGNGYVSADSITITIDPPIGGGTAATAIVTEVSDCGTFTMPNCDGTENTTEYKLIGGGFNSPVVCAGGAGPDAPNYAVTPNPVYYADGPELVVNGNFTNDLSGWTADPPGSEADAFWTPLGVEWTNPDEPQGLSQDILTVGKYYAIDVTLTCDYGPSYVGTIPNPGTAFQLWFGTNLYAEISFSGTQFSFQYTNVQCLGNGNFRLLSFDDSSPFPSDITRLCSYVSIREMGVEYPISCCDCVKYDVYNNRLSGDAIEFYYTDCVDQVIKTQTVQPGGSSASVQVCAVRESIFPVLPLDAFNLQVQISGTQDC